MTDQHGVAIQDIFGMAHKRVDIDVGVVAIEQLECRLHPDVERLAPALVLEELVTTGFKNEAIGAPASLTVIAHDKKVEGVYPVRLLALSERHLQPMRVAHRVDRQNGPGFCVPK